MFVDLISFTFQHTTYFVFVARAFDKNDFPHGNQSISYGLCVILPIRVRLAIIQLLQMK